MGIQLVLPQSRTRLMDYGTRYIHVYCMQIFVERIEKACEYHGRKKWETFWTGTLVIISTLYMASAPGGITSICNKMVFSRPILILSKTMHNKGLGNNYRVCGFIPQNLLLRSVVLGQIFYYSIRFQFSNCNILVTCICLIDSTTPRYQSAPPPLKRTWIQPWGFITILHIIQNRSVSVTINVKMPRPSKHNNF